MDKIPGVFHVQNLGHGDRRDGDTHRMQIESSGLRLDGHCKTIINQGWFTFLENI